MSDSEQPKKPLRLLVADGQVNLAKPEENTMKKQVPDNHFTVINGERIYIGPERRAERRRGAGNERIERLLRNFGLDRRQQNDRRRADSSWLVTSKKVVNQ